MVPYVLRELSLYNFLTHCKSLRTFPDLLNQNGFVLMDSLGAKLLSFLFGSFGKAFQCMSGSKHNTCYADKVYFCIDYSTWEGPKFLSVSDFVRLVTSC